MSRSGIAQLRMIKTLLLLTLFAGFACAETTPEWKAQLRSQTEPTQLAPEDAPAKVGYEKAENNVFPKTASYDGKWTVNGLSILDAEGKVALTWKDIGYHLAEVYNRQLVTGFPAGHPIGSVRAWGRCFTLPSYSMAFG